MVDQRLEERASLRAVVAAEVADVNVQREPLPFGPRVDRKMGFGEDDRAGEPRAFELLEGGVHDREAGIAHHLQALLAETLAIKQDIRIAATAIQVADQVQTVHLRSPSVKREGATRCPLRAALQGAPHNSPCGQKTKTVHFVQDLSWAVPCRQLPVSGQSPACDFKCLPGSAPGTTKTATCVQRSLRPRRAFFLWLHQSGAGRSIFYLVV